MYSLYDAKAFMNEPRPCGPTTCKELQLLFAASAQVMTAPGRPVQVWNWVRVSSTADKREGFACNHRSPITDGHNTLQARTHSQAIAAERMRPGGRLGVPVLEHALHSAHMRWKPSPQLNATLSSPTLRIRKETAKSPSCAG